MQCVGVKGRQVEGRPIAVAWCVQRGRSAFAGPQRLEHADRLRAQAMQRHLQHVPRGAIQPLHVIDRDEHNPILGDGTQHIAHRHAHRARVQ